MGSTVICSKTIPHSIKSKLVESSSRSTGERYLFLGTQGKLLVHSIVFHMILLQNKHRQDRSLRSRKVRLKVSGGGRISVLICFRDSHKNYRAPQLHVQIRAGWEPE